MTEDQIRRLREASASMELNERYSTREIYCSDLIYLSFTSYPQYPYKVIETDVRLIFIEGAIYGKTQEQVTDELSKLADGLFSDGRNVAEPSIRNWLLSTDGEYVLIFIDKSSQSLYVVNDSMGRLPLFYFESSDSSSVSREQKFIVKANSQRKLDRIGIAEYLVLSHNVTGRTMIEGTIRLDPAVMVYFLPAQKKKGVRVLNEWVFGSDIDNGLDAAEHAEMLASRFVQAVRNRIGTFSHLKPVLGLSGGLDSRAVLAGLLRVGARFSAHTNIRDTVSSAKDMSVAEELVKIMPCDWRRYVLGRESLDAQLEIVRNQDGGSSSIMAVAIESYKLIARDYGYDTLYFTGDGGEIVKHPAHPPRRLRSLDDLVRATLLTRYEFHPRLASRLLRISKEELTEAVGSAIEEFPETDFSGKYGHFVFAGRYYRFGMEGEDRVRFYFWLGTPLWDLQFFKTAMAVPDAQRANFVMYAELLKRLDPRTLLLPYADMGALPDSAAVSLQSRLKAIVVSWPLLFRIAKHIKTAKMRADDRHAELDRYVDDIVDTSELVPEYFDVSLLRKLRRDCRSTRMYHLLNTIILRIHFMETDLGAS